MILFFRSLFLFFFFSLTAQSATNFQNAKKMIIDGLGLSFDPRLKEKEHYFAGEIWLKDNCRAYYSIEKRMREGVELDTISLSLRKDEVYVEGTILSNLLPIDYLTRSAKLISFELAYDYHYDCEEEGCSQSAPVTQKVTENSFRIENHDLYSRRVVECFYK
jgi:hypothetical protein